MKRLLPAVALAALIAAPAQGYECNAHGAVVEMGNGIILYLGKSCDAARNDGGTGNWWNAASFLAVQIDEDMYRVAEGAGIDCLPFCRIPD